MKDKVFIDTNIFIYIFDKSSKRKSKKAKNIVRELFSQDRMVVSSQIIQEFINVSVGKFKNVLRKDEVIEFTEEILAPSCDVYPEISLFIQGLKIHKRWKYSFYDSLIIAAALKANCDVLYSEDLRHNQIINGMKIVNPFIDEKQLD